MPAYSPDSSCLHIPWLQLHTLPLGESRCLLASLCGNSELVLPCQLHITQSNHDNSKYKAVLVLILYHFYLTVMADKAPVCNTLTVIKEGKVWESTPRIPYSPPRPRNRPIRRIRKRTPLPYPSGVKRVLKFT